jgi:hypothetical protein
MTTNYDDNQFTLEGMRKTPFTTFCRSFYCEKIKLVVASAIVFLLILIVFIGVSKSYCVLQIHPAINFILLFCALTLLAYCEALHYAVVSVEKWDMSVHAEQFPRACKTHKLVDTPTKVKKFLVGRQFFTIFVVFLISQITSFPFIPENFGEKDFNDSAFPTLSATQFAFLNMLNIPFCRWYASNSGDGVVSDRPARRRPGAHFRPAGLPDLRRGVHAAVPQPLRMRVRRSDFSGKLSRHKCKSKQSEAVCDCSPKSSVP